MLRAEALGSSPTRGWCPTGEIPPAAPGHLAHVWGTRVGHHAAAEVIEQRVPPGNRNS